MSLTNLSLSGNQVAVVIEDAFYNTVRAKFSYFGGIIGGLAVAVGVVYIGGMAALHLLEKNQQKQQKTINQLQQLLEKQQEQITLLEKNLELQKMNNQTWYNTQMYTDQEREKTLRLHSKLITQHTNDIRACFDALNTHTTISDNHTETLMNVVRHQSAQTASINQLHKEIEHEKERISTQREMLLELCDNIDNAVEHVEETRNELEKLSEQMDQSFIEFEVKLEDAIEHFETSKDTIFEKIEEQENQLVSVEDALFEKVFDVSAEFEEMVCQVKEDVKMMGDRVEEMDREVGAVERITEKLETDLGILYDDFNIEDILAKIEFRKSQEGEGEEENKDN
jgi:chromosome segregation ATPase